MKDIERAVRDVRAVLGTKEERRIVVRVERGCFIHKNQRLSSALPKNSGGYKGVCSKNKDCHWRPEDAAGDKKRGRRQERIDSSRLHGNTNSQLQQSTQDRSVEGNSWGASKHCGNKNPIS